MIPFTLSSLKKRQIIKTDQLEMSLFLSVVIKSYLQMAMRLSVILSPYFAFGGGCR